MSGFRVGPLCVVMVGLFTAIGVNAHHSYAMFDQQKTITLEGTVKEFQFTNPHSWIEIMVADATGKLVQWSIEAGAPGALVRGGIKASTFKPGDKVKIDAHPLRDGSMGGSFVAATLADGRVLKEAAGPTPAH